MLITYTTKNYRETQKLGQNFAREILVLSQSKGEKKSAIVIALSGNLGGGKTTFLQGFAKGLGIKEKILSPTFVILKHFKNFYHIDCYRIKNEKDMAELGLKEIMQDPKNIIAIEWPKRIEKILPKEAIFIDFKFVDEKTREINFRT